VSDRDLQCHAHYFRTRGSADVKEVGISTAGVPLLIGSRAEARADEAAARVRERLPDADVAGRANADAVAAARLVILSVPFASHASTIAGLAEALSTDTVVVDATVPLAAAIGGRATRMLGVWQGSAAQQAQELVPDGVRVVSALHTVSAAALGDLGAALDEDVLVAGDRKVDKQVAIDLIERIPGLRCVDCGRLENSRITESLTSLLIGINGRYKAHAGIRITGLPAQGAIQPGPSSGR
jgi:NADPH-dependent F420 reductase